MKNKIIYSIILIIIVYLVIVFINLKFDFTLWSKGLRLTFIYLSLCCVFVACAYDDLR